MTRYYDYVLGLIPAALIGVTAFLNLVGLSFTMALPVGASIALGIMAHAMFVRSPIPGAGSATGPNGVGGGSATGPNGVGGGSATGPNGVGGGSATGSMPSGGSGGHGGPAASGGSD